MQQAKKMKLRLYLALAAMLLPSLMFAAQKNVPLYVCGLATSFNDSTVYFTEIQKIDSAYVDSKTGFLYGRDSYSYQLREQMQKHGLSHATCITFFAKDKKDIDKKYAAFKKRYATKGRYNVKYLTTAEFNFSPIIPDESEMKDAPRQKKAKKLKKDKNK